ncbi:hypothetical protein HO133_003026 [Letharia lupina]|uniref:MARVEL domain-containing protein n=1 Tax=Letharia lupina TaxID=560253 RepID=A0A8H6FAC9_9LECA|nr:uncharacterized protein HO133_003026 [Letharia lupina]KAF6220593.1 hypothetical protein HO133_003026 [Letharia lupina]
MITIRPSRQEMYADDPKFLWKYILRSFAIILAIISIGLIGWSLAHQVVFPNNIYDNYDYAYYDWPYNSDIWFLPWEFISLGLSIIWNVANILVLLIRNRPIHPGANVACDLLLWLGLIVTGTFATVGAGNYFWWYPNDYDNYNQGGPVTESDDNSSSYFIFPNSTVSNATSTTSDLCESFTSCAAQKSYNDAVNRKGTVIAVGAALSFVVLLLHFALFVSACRYTNARLVNAQATVIADRMYNEKVSAGAGGERNPNAGFVPISEPVEQQAPLHYGMPPAPTGMTVGDKGKRRAVMSEELGRGVRYSYEQPEVVVQGPSDERAAAAAYGNDVYEA